MSMGVYIKGMEMPVFEHQSWDIRRGADGKWYMVDTNAETSDGAWHEIVPVLPHGRLIDADYVKNNMRSEHPYVQNAIRATISAAPTIIPAEPLNEEVNE